MNKIKWNLSLYRIFSRAYFHLPFLVIYLYKLHFNLITIELIMAIYGLSVFTYTRLPQKIKPSYYISCKKLLLLGESLKCLGLIFVIFSQNVVPICLAQMFLGLGYGIAAGGDTRFIHFHFQDGGKFQAKSNSFMFASLLIAGLVGSVLFNIDIRLPFVASFFADIITAIVCTRLPDMPGKLILSAKVKLKSRFCKVKKIRISVLLYARHYTNIFYRLFAVSPIY